MLVTLNYINWFLNIKERIWIKIYGSNVNTSILEKMVCVLVVALESFDFLEITVLLAIFCKNLPEELNRNKTNESCLGCLYHFFFSRYLAYIFLELQNAKSHLIFDLDCSYIGFSYCILVFFIKFSRVCWVVISLITIKISKLIKRKCQFKGVHIKRNKISRKVKLILPSN